jgi:hypothetical protein
MLEIFCRLDGLTSVLQNESRRVLISTVGIFFLFFFSTKPGKPKTSQNLLIGMVSNLS